VDGDPANTGVGTDGKQGFCSMGNPKVMEFQKAYIKKVVDTSNGFDNIYYEIANENYYSTEWELALCDYIHEIERAMPRKVCASWERPRILRLTTRTFDSIS